MKVIAIVKDNNLYIDDQTLLVQINGNELKYLIGLSRYDKKKFLVGDELNVCELYEKFTDMRESEDEISKFIIKMKKLVTTLEGMPEVFTNVARFTPPKTKEHP